MANRWGIPKWLEQEVRQRDMACVYCGVKFTSANTARRSAASWEHIINDASIITRENIALCCCGCNSSKGQKQLSVWLQSEYCFNKGISPATVAPIVKQALDKGL
ncbi:MAG: HNH endonuclease [Acidobacteria bacterium]|nr:HNH endonuclease [Acidobacteriota bacterium]MCB9399053.1 HNH endonuclease [Acidobacteriota bacterium]